MQTKEAYILEMKKISKSFPGVKALDEVSFQLKPGEVHALVGENGAGKSTLMKVLGGVYTPDSGEILLNGEKVTFNNPHDALDKKISIIYQELNLVPSLTVAENIFLGKEIFDKKTRVLNRKEMGRLSTEVMEKLGVSGITGREYIRTLSVAKQQLVEIGKSIYNNASILVMDEPTSVLTAKETDKLFEAIDTLKKQGISIIYISHRLEEIVSHCDRITILRDGKNVTMLENKDRKIKPNDIVKHMVGRELKNFYPERRKIPVGEKLLEVENLSHPGMFEDVSFELKKGEILGFSGLVGAGRSEVMRAIYGDIDYTGIIKINGEKVKIHTTHDAIKHGICLVPEDRKVQGLVLGMSLTDNVSLPNADLVSKGLTIIKRKCKELSEKTIGNLQIHPAIADRPAGSFSGGNQQKIVVGKWMARKPKFMILDEPTRGIDVGAKMEIYKLIQDFAEEGVGVIVVSSEMLELLGICTRIISMCNGRVTGNFDIKEASEQVLMTAAAGLTKGA